MTTEEVSNRGHNIPRKLRGSNKAIFGRQLQGAEAPGASDDGLGISPEKFTAYSVVSMHNLLQLTLLGCSFCYFFLFLDGDMAHPGGVALVLTTE